MHFTNCHTVNIDKVWVHDTKANGIHFQPGSEDCTVSNSVIERTGDDSIGFVSHGYTLYGYCRNITITNNILGKQTAGAPGSGIALIGIIGAAVTGNIIQDRPLSGIRITAFFNASEGDAVGGNIVVTGNDISNAGIYSGPALPGAVLDGISVYNHRNVKVANNMVDKTVRNGISVSQGGVKVNVKGNTVVRAGTRGIIVSPLEQAGNYLRLWNDPLLSEGTSLAYVHQHQPAVVGNTVRSSGSDGIYLAGSSSRYISEARVTDNHVYLANRNNVAGATGITALLLDKSVVRDNYVGDPYPG